MKKLLLIPLAIILVFGMILGGCGEAEKVTTTATQTATETETATETKTATATETETTVETKYGGILKLVPYNAPVTPLGYPAESNPNSIELAMPVLETLVSVQDTIEGVLATSWVVADDGSSITMNLRQGVKFHDGSDFNAEVAKWNLDLLTEAEKVPQFESVDIIDDYTIRINLKTWANSVLTNMERNTAMISKEAFEKNGIEWARWHPVGTGPFKFVEYERDVKIVYERNDNYWQEGKPYLDGIEYTVIADDTVRKIALQNGDIHVLRAAGTIAQELLGLDFNYNTIPGGTFVLIPDSANADSPLADLTVRQAISYAIDREAIANSLGFGLASPAYQLYPGFPMAVIPGLEKQEYNPDEARRLLALAGYEDGFDMTIYVFVMTPQDFVYAIESMLEAVGITVEVEIPEPGLYADYRFNGWSDGMMGHGMASGQNLNEWIKLYLAGVQFPSLQRSEGFLEALDESLEATTLDPAKLQAVLKVINDDLMVIPYAEEVAITFFQKGVYDSGMLDYSLDTWTPEDCWITPDLR